MFQLAIDQARDLVLMGMPKHIAASKAAQEFCPRQWDVPSWAQDILKQL